MLGFTSALVTATFLFFVLHFVLVAILGIIGYAALITFVEPNPDISNQTIVNGLEDCNAIGNFEWTVMITSETYPYAQCW